MRQAERATYNSKRLFMQALALLLIGYSVFAAPAIALTLFRGADYVERRSSQAAGIASPAALAAT
jgi:hypothetical protein